MPSLYSVSDKGLFANQVEIHGTPPRTPTADPPSETPRVFVHNVAKRLDRSTTVAESLLCGRVREGPTEPPPMSNCCGCLRYCNTIAVSESVSSGIGILDPTLKVEPAPLATLILPPPRPSTPTASSNCVLKSGHESQSQCLTKAGTSELLSAPSHTLLRKQSFAASDFLLDSFYAAKAAVKAPVKRAASALACVDDELLADCQRRQWLRRKWEEATQLAIDRPPGLSVFHHPEDRCQCACHCLTAKYVVDELLHSGYTSTVVACKRMAVINPELFSRCYGHIMCHAASYFNSSSANTIAKGGEEEGANSSNNNKFDSDQSHLLDATSSVNTPIDMTVGGILEDTSSSTTGSPTMVKVPGHSSLLISGSVGGDTEPSGDSTSITKLYNQAVRSACSWLLPIQNCEELVIKIIHKDRCGRDELDRCLQEAKFLSVLHHRNIARMLASYDGTNELWMFFERATYTDLEDATTGKTFSEDTVKMLVSQVLLALQYIHKRRIIHCDVKPKNILLYSTRDHGLMSTKDRKFNGADWRHIELRLGDFGLAQSLPVDRNCIKFDGVRGSHGFFAPEVLLRRDYDFKIDVWAVGIIAFMLLVGYEPFYPPSKCIQEEVAFESRYWGSISPEAKDFVSRLLMFDPRMRASADEALAHPWLRES